AEALAVTGELLRREPAAADALLAHGILLLELGQPAAALAALDRGRAALRPAERLLSEPDPLGTLQLYRAIALQSVGQKDAAEVALRHALRLSPERAAEAAADPQLAELTPAAQPPCPAGYAALRQLARTGLVDPRPSAPDEAGGPAAPLASASQAHAQGAGPLAEVDSARGRSRSEAGMGLASGSVDVAPPAGAGASAGRAASRPSTADPLEDEELIWTALRGQVAELLVDALAALDADADAGARRELVARAVHGLGALRQLAPQTFTAQAQRVRAIIESAAAALGVAAELGELDIGQ
ncbi:MAG TPA: hypothetical protein PLW65_09715, partial [Pseudomonadota bacterium]|nr:hypothetical protein [Pseudomonadota bacterium]